MRTQYVRTVLRVKRDYALRIASAEEARLSDFNLWLALAYRPTLRTRAVEGRCR